MNRHRAPGSNGHECANRELGRIVLGLPSNEPIHELFFDVPVALDEGLKSESRRKLDVKRSLEQRTVLMEREERVDEDLHGSFDRRVGELEERDVDERVHPLDMAFTERPDDGVLAIEVLVERADTHTGLARDAVGTEATPKTVSLQNPSGGLQDRFDCGARPLLRGLSCRFRRGFALLHRPLEPESPYDARRPTLPREPRRPQSRTRQLLADGTLNTPTNSDAHASGPLPLDALPSLPRLPVLASLPWLVHRHGFVARMLELAERHRAVGAFRVPMPDGRAPIFVGNVSLANDLVDESRFEKVLDGPLVHIRDFAGDGLFTAHSDEPSWHRAHHILSPGFSTSALDRYYPAMTSSLEALMAHWGRARAPVDVVLDMTKLTLDTISLAGFDYRFDSFARPELDPFLKSLARALQESIDVLQRPKLLAPLFRGRRARYQRDIEDMFSLVDTVIRERKQRPVETWPRDFLSLMLNDADPKSGEKLSDENIRYQILTFLIAGHETTAGLLAFTFHELARNRSLFARVRREVDQAIGTATPTMKQVLGLDLVRRTLSEALRLWPTVPVVTRAAKDDTVLAGRYDVKKGQSFGLLLNAVHRDPVVWKEPSRFDPDRFLPEAVKVRPAAAYKPFGIGRRSCTGKHFALIEAALCVAMVVRDFDFDDPGPLVLAPTVSPKPKDFRLHVRPRARQN